MTEVNRTGWKFLVNSPKAHYFVDGRSLCGRWMNLGVGGFEDDNHNSPDNCTACRKKRDKLFNQQQQKETTTNV